MYSFRVTGPEHYKRAEQLLAPQDDRGWLGGENNEAKAVRLAEAQVHATLAVAAAALYGPQGDPIDPALARSLNRLSQDRLDEALREARELKRQADDPDAD